MHTSKKIDVMLCFETPLTSPNYKFCLDHRLNVTSKPHLEIFNYSLRIVRCFIIISPESRVDACTQIHRIWVTSYVSFSVYIVTGTRHTATTQLMKLE